MRTIYIQYKFIHEGNCATHLSVESISLDVDYIEEKTGCDFFQYLPDEIENSIEKKVYSK